MGSTTSRLSPSSFSSPSSSSPHNHPHPHTHNHNHTHRCTCTGSYADEKRSPPSLGLGLSNGLSKLSLSEGAATAPSAAAPLSKDGSLGANVIEGWEDAVSKNPKLTVTRSILPHTPLLPTLQSRPAISAIPHIFSHVLPTKTLPITNQKSSGRCWIFATTNVIRYDVMKRLKVEEFQLSQSYLFFWDKLNKCNYYLESMIELALPPSSSQPSSSSSSSSKEPPLDIDRLITHLSSSDNLISDGGQWDMIINLLTTYGVVPRPVFPESAHSELSSPLNKILRTKLREDGLRLREMAAELLASASSPSPPGSGPALDDPDAPADKEKQRDAILTTLRAHKESLLLSIYTILSSTLGIPPSPSEPFSWEYYDDEGKQCVWTGTPVEFYRSFSSRTYPPEESFSIINDPRNEYGVLYGVERLGNLWGGREVLYVNTEIETLKNMVVKMIKAGQPVFFGCDVGQSSDRTAGIMDTALYTYESTFDITLTLSKADRLRSGESSMTHAMVISGVHLDKETGKPVRYRVENSWGPDVGDKGYFVMSDRWFEEFVYQVVVPKALAPKELVKVFQEGEKKVLPPWDPMGSLA